MKPKTKILIVDDDENTLKLYERALDKAGFEVKTSSQAIGTTNKAKEFCPEIIILDVMMPALSGQNLIEILKKNVPGNPLIILLSNKSEDELKKIAQEFHADDYLTKMSGPLALVKKINALLQLSK